MNNIVCVILSKNNTFVRTITFDSFLSIPNELYGEFRLLETIGNTYVYKNMKRNATFLKKAFRELLNDN